LGQNVYGFEIAARKGAVAMPGGDAAEITRQMYALLAGHVTHAVA
jgi:hypothetical protein